MHVCAQCNGTDLFFLSDHDVREAGEGEEVSGGAASGDRERCKKKYIYMYLKISWYYSLSFIVSVLMKQI